MFLPADITLPNLFKYQFYLRHYLQTLPKLRYYLQTLPEVRYYLKTLPELSYYLETLPFVHYYMQTLPKLRYYMQSSPANLTLFYPIDWKTDHTASSTNKIVK